MVEGNVLDPEYRSFVGLHPLAVRHGMTIAEAERELILRTLDETGNNKAEAARRLGIDVKTVRNKLRAWGIER